MKIQLMVLGVLMFGLTVVAPEMVKAIVCPAGKTAVTIVNPAGKIIEICVSDAAVDGLGSGGDVVISATCPCFSQEDIDIAMATEPLNCSFQEGGVGIPSGDACSSALCQSASFFFVSGESTEGDIDCDIDPRVKGSGISGNWCASDRSIFTFTFLTAEEADACVAILDTFTP